MNILYLTICTANHDTIITGRHVKTFEFSAEGAVTVFEFHDTRHDVIMVFLDSISLLFCEFFYCQNNTGMVWRCADPLMTP